MSKSAIPPGKVKSITSPSNPIIKEIRALALKKNRDATGRFLVEGRKLVLDGMDGGWTVHTLLYAAGTDTESGLGSLLARARTHGASILEVSERVLSVISRRDNPQTVIGVFSRKWISPADIGADPDSLWIALDRVRDPGNLGTILRTADAVGASGVILVGEVTDPFALEAVRATMGSLFHVALCHMSQQEFLEWRKGWRGSVLGTHLDGELDYRSAGAAPGPVLLLMGNEQQGLPDELAQCCDFRYRIPMAGKADSLNLAIATGIMVFEIRRERLPRLQQDETTGKIS